jgi:HK97 family phage major capsid protein/HK97 family phage prohead protease
MEKFEIKAALQSSDTGEITGMAWLWDKADSVGDVIERKAINSVGTIPLLFGHDQNQPIGVWDSITETDTGLEVKGRLLINDVVRAREVHALIREKAITGLSIGFITTKSTARKNGGRTITALDLKEISCVAIPCHPDARIISAKADDATTQEVKTMELALKERAEELTALETKMSANLEAQLAKLEAKMNRPAPKADNDNGPSLESKAFANYARFGEHRMDPVEAKALTVGVNASAGYLAPPSFESELLKSLVMFSPIRSYAKVVRLGSVSAIFPRRIGTTAATWVAETAARTASQPTYEQLTIAPFELSTYVDVSNQLLEDNAYNLEGELASDLGEAFGVAEGAAFIAGSGVGQPKGLLTSIANELKTGVAADFPATNPADKIIDLFHKLPSVHAQNAVFLMNRNTLGVVRKWKDSTGNYLLITPVTAGAPNTILGRPVIEDPSMPDIGAGTSPIVFGDMSGFRIVDRIDMTMLRDPYTQAANGLTRFLARKRVGSDVTNPDRFYRLKCAV